MITKEEFFAHVKTNENGCLIWQRCHYPKGYGCACWHGVATTAHRVAWMIAYGDIPPGMLVCHKCDVRNCCNPEHLFLGTPKDNTQDMMVKGRSVRGRASWAKLTEDNIREIRSIYAAGGVSMRELGRRFPVSYSHIRRIIHRTRWTHVK